MQENDFFWSVMSTGVAIGQVENAFAYENVESFPGFQQNNSLYTLIDTGSTACLISYLYFESLIYNMFDYAGIDDWVFENQVIKTKCAYETLLPPVFFQIDGAWIEARPEDYFFDFAGDGNECMLYFVPINDPLNIIGMPAHVDYYTIHEPLTGQVHWAPHKESPKSDIVSGPAPT